ncbi:PREDICTED: uncharacterized protein LOC109152141 [Ipomoea nil]|uniref:uncharacterized protein LOC109152141 n=1 Tax=Ipomoea nil TaxID=35883 RepID=UPI000901C9B2|nr:PREDICTED: uncharacterized protein LOC109152141 [Ipomoea nil]
MPLVPIDHSEITTTITTDERNYLCSITSTSTIITIITTTKIVSRSLPIYQVYCRADHKYALTIRDNKVKDTIGLPSFALVNKATGEAIQHGVAGVQLVQLLKYYEPNDEGVDHSILWSEACIKDDNGEYKAIRMVNNIGMNMDAFGATKERGGVQDGTAIGLWEWNGGDNQRWKIIPY